MNDILTTLSRIEEMEKSLSEMYEWLGKTFKDNPEVSGFFRHMSHDEISHRDLVRYQIRIVRKAKQLFYDVEADLDGIDSILHKIKQIKENIPFTIDSSLKFVSDIESSLAEQYYLTIIKKSNKELSDLISNMVSGCKKHQVECIEMAQKLNIALNDENPM